MKKAKTMNNWNVVADEATRRLLKKKGSHKLHISCLQSGASSDSEKRYKQSRQHTSAAIKEVGAAMEELSVKWRKDDGHFYLIHATMTKKQARELAKKCSSSCSSIRLEGHVSGGATRGKRVKPRVKRNFGHQLSAA